VARRAPVAGNLTSHLAMATRADPARCYRDLSLPGTTPFFRLATGRRRKRLRCGYPQIKIVGSDAFGNRIFLRLS
jgi:hypothetical protein